VAEDGVVIADRLVEWVDRLAALAEFLAGRGLLARLADQPAAARTGGGDHPDARRVALDVLATARTDRERAVGLLRQLAALSEAGEAGRTFGDLVAKWLRRDLASEAARLAGLFPERAIPPPPAPVVETPHPLPPPASPAPKHEELPKLAPRQRSLLRVMMQNNVTSRADRMSRKGIVELLARKWKPNSWADDFADLGRKGLTASEPGAKGGTWLTPRGIEVAEQLPAE
jgi:hypothetical protein